MNRRTFGILAIALALTIGVFCFALLQPHGAQKVAQRGNQLQEDIGRITEPMRTSVRNFNPVLPNKSKEPLSVSRRPAIIVEDSSDHQSTPKPPPASLTIFAAEPQPAKPGLHGPKAEYAPAFRMIKCQLVNTVDSSNIETPIIGLVTEDLWWNGKVVIRANSEIHGIANVDRVRERIASSGEFTFVLNEPAGVGRELVVRGMVLDMEKDDEVNSYGITDGSAGLRGDIIRTANNDVIKLYAASLVSGMAGALSSGASGIMGNRVFTNGTSLGLSALQGAVVNPLAGGTQSILDRYAEQIASTIDRDGFFVRVPAGKQFYVYCSEAIDLSRAHVAADDERLSRDDADFQRQQQRLEVRRALPVEASELLNPLLPSLDLLKKNKK
jgi:type F conjugative transfer system protein TrbI